MLDQLTNDPSDFRQRFPYLHLLVLFAVIPTLAGIIGGGSGAALSGIGRRENSTWDIGPGIGNIVGGASGLISGGWFGWWGFLVTSGEPQTWYVWILVLVLIVTGGGILACHGWKSGGYSAAVGTAVWTGKYPSIDYMLSGKFDDF